MTLFKRVLELLKKDGAEEITVVGGGIIPEEDIPALKEAGVKEIFLPGTSLDTILDWTRSNVKPRA